MLTHINIDGFKSIHKIQDLELGKINVIIGANGSGKTNLLEAIGVLSAALTGRIDSESLRSRGVRLSPNELYKTSLKEKNRQQKITFRAEGNWDDISLKYHLEVNPQSTDDRLWTYEVDDLWHGHKKIIEKDSISDPTSQWEAGDAIIHDIGGRVAYLGERIDYKSVGQAPKIMISYLREYAIYTPITPMLRGVQPDTTSRDPIGLMGGRLAEAVDDILNLNKGTFGELNLDEVLELLDWVDDFRITTPSRELLSPDVPSLRNIVEFKDYWMGMKANRISGYDASEGSLYVLFMLVLAQHPRAAHFFAIDNFDQALNPRLARALTRLFCRLILEAKSTKQVFLTTHNPLVLDGLNLRDDRIRLFTAERNQSSGGATVISRVHLSDKVLKSAENGTPLSQMWVMGLLGGVPDIF